MLGKWRWRKGAAPHPVRPAGWSRWWDDGWDVLETWAAGLIPWAGRHTPSSVSWIRFSRRFFLNYRHKRGRRGQLYLCTIPDSVRWTFVSLQFTVCSVALSKETHHWRYLDIFSLLKLIVFFKKALKTKTLNKCPHTHTDYFLSIVNKRLFELLT